MTPLSSINTFVGAGKSQTIEEEEGIRLEYLLEQNREVNLEANIENKVVRLEGLSG